MYLLSWALSPCCFRERVHRLTVYTLFEGTSASILWGAKEEQRGEEGPKDLTQPLDRRLVTVVAECCQHAGEGRKGIRPLGVLRALGHLACDHRWPQRTLGPIISRLNERVVQKAQQVIPVMMPTELVQQPLVVRVRQQAVAETIGDRPVPVRRHISMPASHLPPAQRAPAYLHPVLRHLGPRNWWDVCGVGQVHSLMLQPSTTLGAGFHSHLHPHLHWRLGGLIRRGRLAVAQGASSGLASRSLGVGRPRPLRKGSGLAPPAPPVFGVLFAQPFHGRSQLPNMLSESDNQSHQIVVLQRSHIFLGCKHSQSLQTLA